MHDIEDLIKAKINQLEQDHGIRILFACESGSRAWGFPSPDSDYDVRFIYAHPEDWYLSLQEERDVMDFPINQELDINGWDLRKSLRLLIKHNAVIFEWLQSPIVYASKEEFTNRFYTIARTCFSPIASMHHYLSNAKKFYAECISSPMVKLKRYKYCLRCTLAGEWIAKYRSIPPMELSQLLLLIGSDHPLTCKIADLVEIKAAKEESYLHPQEPLLESYLKEGIARCETAAPSLPGCKPDLEKLNAFFRDIVRNIR